MYLILKGFFINCHENVNNKHDKFSDRVKYFNQILQGYCQGKSLIRLKL